MIKKMMKLNQKGFVLAETLIVTLFVMVIFSMLYSNFYPLLAEYEVREGYDDVDSKYAVYWIKKTIEDASYVDNNIPKLLDGSIANKYIQLNCNNVLEANEKRNNCKALMKDLGVDGCNAAYSSCKVYITKYEIGPKNKLDTEIYFKNKVKENAGGKFDSDFQAYISTLPNYKVPSLNNAEYRVIAVFSNKDDNGEELYKSYATIEVRK